MRSPSLFIAPLALLSLQACVGTSSNLPQPGHYQGSLIRLNAGTIETTQAQADLEADSSSGYLLKPTASDPKAQPIRVAAQANGGIELTDHDLSAAPIELAVDGDCFSEKQENTSVRLCTTSTTIEISANDQKGSQTYLLKLERTDAVASIPLEEPRSYKISEAVQKALSSSFVARIEFERASQAKLLAKNAYQNLLPHFSLATIGTIAELNPYAAVGTIGDLVPFLLPSRWMHAAEQTDLSKAEADALLVMQADIGVQVEAMAYAINRDKDVLAEYDTTITEIDAIQKRVEWREKLGDFPDGTANNLLSTLHALQSDRSTLDLNIREQLAFVAQSLGMISPKAVSDLVLEGNSQPIDQAQPLKDELVWGPATQSSYELKQMDALIAAAQERKDAVPFEWLDPSGDPTASMGFGLGSAIDIKTSQLSELRATREQSQATLLQKVTQAVLEYNHALEESGKARADLALQNNRVKSTLENLRLNNEMNLIDLSTVFQDRLRAQTLLASAQATFRIQRSKLDRLLLHGYYEALGHKN